MIVSVIFLCSTVNYLSEHSLATTITPHNRKKHQNKGNDDVRAYGSVDHYSGTAVQRGCILAVVVCRIPGIWQILMGNKPIQGGGHSHAYCKPSETLE
jgi:hypothetical protein